MISVTELKRWLSTQHDTDLIAIDEGGLTLTVFDSGEMETGSYLEIGGVPEDVPED